MSEDVSKYGPPNDELLEVLGMRVIDVMNRLCLQLEHKKEKEDYIQFKGVNGFSSKCYELTISLKELE